MCSWLCDLFKVRCQATLGYIDDICALNTFEDSNCSF